MQLLQHVDDEKGRRQLVHETPAADEDEYRAEPAILEGKRQEPSETSPLGIRGERWIGEGGDGRNAEQSKGEPESEKKSVRRPRARRRHMLQPEVNPEPARERQDQADQCSPRDALRKQPAQGVGGNN